jgi:hypothetical protein
LNASQAVLNSALALSRLEVLPNGGPGILTVTFHSQMPGVRARANRIRPMGWSSSRML